MQQAKHSDFPFWTMLTFHSLLMWYGSFLLELMTFPPVQI